MTLLPDREWSNIPLIHLQHDTIAIQWRHFEQDFAFFHRGAKMLTPISGDHDALIWSHNLRACQLVGR